jgi:hypothetical protein
MNSQKLDFVTREKRGCANAAKLLMPMTFARGDSLFAEDGGRSRRGGSLFAEGVELRAKKGPHPSPVFAQVFILRELHTRFAQACGG